MYSFLWYSDNADLASNWNLSEACSSLWVQPVDWKQFMEISVKFLSCKDLLQNIIEEHKLQPSQ